MDPEHRRLLWALRCRIDHTIYMHTNKDKTFGATRQLLSYMEARGMLISRGNIVNYSQVTFWRMMMILSERFNYLRHHPMLVHLVDCLLICCSKFTLLVEKDPRLLNHPSHSEKTSSGFTRVNETFFDDTERLFVGLHRRLLFAEFLQHNQVKLDDISKEGKVNFFIWMRSLTESTFKDIIRKQFVQNLFNNHVWADEKDRLNIEDRFGELSASRAVSKYRPPFIEKMSVFTTSAPIPRMVASSESLLLTGFREEHYTDPLGLAIREVDVDFELLTMVVLKCYFLASASFPIDPYVWMRWEENDALPLYHISRFTAGKFHRMDTSERFPIFVQYFNEIGIFFRGTLYVTDNIVATVAHWVRLAEENLGGKLPDSPTANTHELYKRLWPEKAIEEITTSGSSKDDPMQGVTVEMPLMYSNAEALGSKMRVVQF